VRRRAVFLDRDGTLNERPAEHCYLRSPTQFRWLPGAREGAALLAKAGYVLAVVSNQRGLARGLLDRAALRAIEARVQRGLAAHGCRIEAFRYCPHDLDMGCSCRKPAPGLLLDLAKDLRLDLGRSWMIGDSESDVLAGTAAGCRTILLGRSPRDSRPDAVLGSLLDAGRLLGQKAYAA